MNIICDKFKCIKWWEYIFYVVLLGVILSVSYKNFLTDINVYYANDYELSGNKVFLYVDSGSGWNDKEGYSSTINWDNDCTISIPSYGENIEIRFDPIANTETLYIEKIEVEKYGIVRNSWEGEELKQIFESSINVISMEYVDGVMEIVPLNSDPEIFVSDTFTQEITKTMSEDIFIKGLLTATLFMLFILRLYIFNIYKFVIRHKKSLIYLLIWIVLGLIFIEMSTLKIELTYKNGEELKYDWSTIYIDLGNGWEHYDTGYIGQDGTVVLEIPKTKQIINYRVDPTDSDKNIKLNGLKVYSMGVPIIIYEKDELDSIIHEIINGTVNYNGNEFIEVEPVNIDPQILLSEFFYKEMVRAMWGDRICKTISMIALFCGCSLFLRTVERKGKLTSLRKYYGAVCGLFICIIAMRILFKDIISGEFSFSYTNVLFPIAPFDSQKIIIKGLTGSDMADSVFPEIFHMFDGGRINTWNEYNAFGYDTTTAFCLLSPFMWLCYGITAGGQFIRYMVKAILGLVGMYLFLRNIKCNKPAAWMGGIIYIFSSSMVMWGGWPHTDVACLAPLLFYFTNKLIENVRDRNNKIVWYWLSVTLVLYFMLVAGMPPYVIYFLYLGVAYELYNMICIHNFNFKKVIWCVSIIFCAVVLAGLMSFAYTGEIFFATQSYQEYRSEVGYAMHTAAPRFLWTFLFPQFEITGGSAIEYNVFSGIWIVFLVPAFFIIKNNKDKIFWGSSVGILVCTIFTTYSGYIFQYIPLINSSRKTRLIVLLNFTISILSAIVLSSLMSEKFDRKKKVIVSVGWGASIFAILILARLCQSRVGAIQFAQILQMEKCILVAFICMQIIMFASKRTLATYILIGTIAVSGAIFAQNGLQMMDSDAKEIPEPTESIAFLQEATGREYRMATVGASNFVPELNSYYDINNIHTHSYINTDPKMIEYLSGIDSKIYDIPTKTSIKNVDSWNLLLYGSVKYLLVPTGDIQDINLSGVDCEQRVFNDGESVIELNNALPRVYLATEVIIKDTEEEVLNAMIDEYIPHSMFTTESLIDETSATIELSDINIISEEGNSLVVEAKTDGSGYIVISDYLNNNWDAYVNGEKVELLSCNYLFNAIRIEDAGQYTIELDYHNKEKNMYWTITLVSTLFFILILLGNKRFSKMLLLGIPDNLNQNKGA